MKFEERDHAKTIPMLARRLSALCLIVLGLLPGCGADEEIPPLPAGQYREVVHLVDRFDEVELLDAPQVGLEPPAVCTMPFVATEVERGVYAAELLWPAVPGTVELIDPEIDEGAKPRPEDEGAAAENPTAAIGPQVAKNTRQFVRRLGSYVVVMRRDHREAEDLTYLESRRRERDVAREIPTHVLLKDDEVVSFIDPTLSVRTDAVLRVRARTADNGRPARLAVQMGPEFVEAIEVDSDEFRIYEIELPSDRERIGISLKGQPPAGEPVQLRPRQRRVLVDWLEIESGHADRVYVRSDGPPEGWALRYLPIAPGVEEDCVLPPDHGTESIRDGRTWICGLGVPTTLQFERTVDEVWIDGELVAEDTNRVELPSLSGGAEALHELTVRNAAGAAFRLEQPLARLLPCVIDPVLRDRDDGRSESARRSRESSTVVSRLACRWDHRLAFWLPAPSRLEIAAELKAGDRLRYSTGVDTMTPLGDLRAEGEVGFRVRWRPAAGEDRVLGEHESGVDESWDDHEVVVRSSFAGRGILVFETFGDERAAMLAGFADPRIVPPRDHQPPRPNLVVYLIDTLRADAMGCYGNARDTSPSLDAWAEASYLFEQCLAASSWTRPSTASILSGLQPVDHRCLFLGSKLPHGVRTLPETLRAAGYSTWGVVFNQQVGYRSLHFDQGFHRFVSQDAVWTADVDGDYSSERANAFLEPWLERHADEPFLLYVHTMDMHSPYRAPEKWEREFAGEYEGPLEELELTPKVTFKSAGVFDSLGERDIRYLMDVYEAQLRNHDDAMAEFLEMMDELDLDPITALVSDHGEEFYEHRGWEHTAKMWQEVLHVPLVISVPESLQSERSLLPPGTRIADPVQHVDLFATLLDLVGAEPLAPHAGETLVPLMQGKRKATPVFVEESEELGALREGSKKLIWNDQRLSRIEIEPLALYDLERDPRERENLAQEQPQEVARLLELRQSMQERYRDLAAELKVLSEDAELSSIMMQQLAELGYADSGP